MKNALIMLVALMISCQKDSDPAKDYSDLKTVPKHDTPSHMQKVFVNPLIIQMLGSTQNPNASFRAGEDGVVQFQVTKDPRVIEFRMEVVEKPEGSTFEPSQDKNIFQFKWKPDLRFITSGDHATALLKLRALVTSASDPALNSASSETYSYTLSVTRYSTQPKILGINKLGTDAATIFTVEEGAKIEFEVIAEDPAATLANGPRLSQLPCASEGNTENPLSEALLIKHQLTKPLGDNKFQFNLLLDLSQSRFSQERAQLAKNNGFEICLELTVISIESNLSAAPYQKRIFVKFKSTQPTLTLSTKNSVRIGVENPITFIAEVDTALGELEVSIQGLEKLPGTTQVNKKSLPGPVKKIRWLYEIMWDVPADEKLIGQKYDLQVIATHKLAGVETPQKTDEASMQLSVTANPHPIKPRTSSARKPPVRAKPPATAKPSTPATAKPEVTEKPQVTEKPPAAKTPAKGGHS